MVRERHHASAMSFNRVSKSSSSQRSVMVVVVVEGGIVGEPYSLLVQLSQDAKTVAAAILSVEARVVATG